LILNSIKQEVLLFMVIRVRKEDNYYVIYWKDINSIYENKTFIYEYIYDMIFTSKTSCILNMSDIREYFRMYDSRVSHIINDFLNDDLEIQYV